MYLEWFSVMFGIVEGGSKILSIWSDSMCAQGLGLLLPEELNSSGLSKPGFECNGRRRRLRKVI